MHLSITTNESGSMN